MSIASLKRAAVINAISRYSQIIIHFILNMILARILSPEDYGIIAVITVFTTFFSMTSDIGFGSAVIQNKELDEEDINTIFSFTCYLAIGLMIFFCLFSFPIALIYDNHAYIELGFILSFSLEFNLLNMIPNALLLREKRFILIGLRNISVTLFTSVIAIIMALKGGKFYALAIQSTMNAILTFLWNFSNSKLKFRKKIKIASIKKIIHFSIFQFGFNIVQYFSRNLDNLLTGRYMGEIKLGIYDKAYRLARYPMEGLASVVTPILHPVLSEYQKDRNFIYKHYVNIMKVFSVIAAYISILFYLCPEEITLIVFGRKWLESAKCLKLFSITIWTQMLGASTGAIYQSLNKTKWLFITGLINSSITATGFIICARYENIEIMAGTFAVTSVINFFISTFILLCCGFEKSYLKFISLFIPECLISTITILIGISIQRIYNFESKQAMFLIKYIVVSICYGIGIIISGQGKKITVLKRNKQV